ncbi:MAG: ribokinase [Pelagibacteraceae bacterium]|jgi:ribokinase
MSYISVFGIFVADISFVGKRIPTVGESMIGSKYNISPGGKGCNQATAIAKLGGKVSFISKIGKDTYGDMAIKILSENKIEISAVDIDPKSQTGVAGIMLDETTGKNAINVIVGAPATLTIKDLEKHFNIIDKSEIFLTQLETPVGVTLECLKKAKENNVLTILNPAPAAKIDNQFFKYVDYFTPNETEAEFYTDIKILNIEDAKKAAKSLIQKGLKKIIITLGEKGLFYTDGKEEIFIEATKVKAIDTIGAGDAFNGGFAYALLQKKPIKDALIFANKVAGLSTTKQGAGNAMPSLEEVNKLTN